MSTPVIQFILQDAANTDRFIHLLSEQYQVKNEADTALSRTYLDSFDWRLYQAGVVLYSKADGRKKTLVCQAEKGADSDELLATVGNMPKFSGDLPEGQLRDKLSPLLAMRALLPQVEVKGRESLFRVLDEEEKTVLRFFIEALASRSPGVGEFRELPRLIVLQPVRGYSTVVKRARKILQQEMGLELLSTDLMQLALAAIGRKPADYSSSLNFQFSPEQTAGAVACQIHLRLLGTLVENLPGTIANLDSEFLHELRVAVRRARSALTQIKDVFNPEAAAVFNERMAWVGQITGQSRDIDVYLLDYDTYRSSLPQRFQADLAPLHEFLLAHQKSAYRSMASQLKSKQMQTFVDEWRAFLNSAPVCHQAAVAAELPVREVADKRIYRMYKRVLAEGLEINDSSPATEFHELRKSCKKLRYLIEFFQSLYPDSRIQSLIKAMKALLDNLGAYQDTEVQASKLREFAHQMVKEGDVPADTLLAMGILVDGLLRRQQQARNEFYNCFNLFSGKENRAEFKSLFGKAGKNGKKS